MDDDVLNEQIAYYRARAPEYDDWFERRGMYDFGPELNERWFAEHADVVRALQDFAAGGRVLELASGTGWWTERLVQLADEVVAVDASAETIELNRSRVGSSKVRFVQADLFSWEPDDRYDVVFFAFWLSHVPEERFDEFWELVDRALAPDGRIFFVDNLRARFGASQELRQRIQPVEHPDGTVIRRLSDGREFRIVKVYREPEELQERLRALGWEVDVRGTGNFFLYGSGSRR